MLQLLLDLVFPRMSLSGEEGEWVTAEERRAMARFPMVLHAGELREHGMPSLERLAAAAAYHRSPLLQRAVHLFKYRQIRGLEETLGSVLADAALSLRVQDGVFCPVPLHWTRRFARGFNQSELLARRAGALLRCETLHLLRRVRPTGHQARRGRLERMSAMHGAFRLSFGAALPRSVILVDDVCTTGATLEACAKALRQAGVEHVEAVVLALG
jgi:competence protein ComFC